MPVWRDATRQWATQQGTGDGRLVVLGIIQEQHAERAGLYAQWQQLDWPILHDPINVIENRAVPIFVAIDEHGVVRSTRPKIDTLAADFLDVEFPAPAESNDSPADSLASATPPDLSALRAAAESQNRAAAWQRYADAQALWGPAAQREQAIAAYEKAIRSKPSGKSVDGDRHFRLGTAYRMRYDSPFRQAGDFQAAADHWGRALAIDPNQYIWRRRIEQYGPRLNKPYPFYDWIETAQREITARGETPVELQTPLTESEIARPGRSLVAAGNQPEGAAAAEPKSPDPEGRINRDSQDLIQAEVAVVPAKIKPGGTARVHITFRPNVER